MLSAPNSPDNQIRRLENNFELNLTIDHKTLLAQIMDKRAHTAPADEGESGAIRGADINPVTTTNGLLLLHFH
jgi:hypothetical protein